MLFFKQKTAYELRISDCSSDVCSSDLPSMGSEDFSFMLQSRPGAYFRLGQGGAESGCLLHNSRFDFNDAVIPLGSAIFCAMAERGMPLEIGRASCRERVCQ